MKSQPSTVPIEMVAFDLGGVLLRINRTWKNAALQAGLDIDAPESLSIWDLAEFNDYQAGRSDEASYLDALAGRFSVVREDALAMHQAIVVGTYPGVDDLIGQIRGAGLRTGVLSNTNALHWELFCSPFHFPGIASIESKLASHEVGLEKPQQAIYKLFEKRNKVKGAGVLFFDDSMENVLAAREVGWRSHLIDHEADPAAQMRGVLNGLGFPIR